MDFKIFRNLSENSPRMSQKITSHEFCPKHSGPEFVHSPNCSEKFEKPLVDIRFQFCLASKCIGQDGAIPSDDQPVRLQQNGAR